MENKQQENLQELYSSYANSDDELVMTEDIENLLNNWLNEFEEEQQQEDTTSKFP